MPTGTNITYDQLLSQLPSYLERKDDAFKAQIPIFVNLAENRLATDMKQLGFQAVVTGVLALNNVQPKPAFWRTTLSYSILVQGEWVNLKLRQLEWIKKYWPQVGQVATPEYYADYNINYFYVAGTPDQTYPFELVYEARLDPLGVDHQENWMTLNAPQALLYATLLEAALWCKNPQAEQKWLQQYQIAVGGITVEDQSRKKDRNAEVK